jgi:hypothetical protein
MHTALLYITGFLLLAALILIFRRSLIAFCIVMVLLWWTGGHTTDPKDFATVHGAQLMVAKTAHGYTYAVGYLVGAVEHGAQAVGLGIAPPAT